MNGKLQTAFAALESQRLELMSRLKGLTPDDLTWSPPGKWSIIHIVSHMMTGERMALEYVRKKILGVESVGDSGLYERFKVIALVVSQRLPFLKFKAPQLIVERTVVYEDLDKVDKEWSALRHDWKTFLDAVPERYARRNIFRHVVAGRLNLEQGMRFLSEHIIHHMPQIDRLISGRHRHNV
jgi:hypothetical protein